MKKIKSKKELLSKWNQKIGSQKYYYGILLKSGQTEKPFEESEVYKGLEQRKKRALYRYENREKISKQRKERREFFKEQERLLQENEQNIDESYSGSAIDAFKGRASTGDLAFALSVKTGNFNGKLFVVDMETDTVLEDSTIRDITRYFKMLAFWINILFSKSDGYKIFNSEVVKKQWYEKDIDTLFYITEIYINE